MLDRYIEERSTLYTLYTMANNNIKLWYTCKHIYKSSQPSYIRQFSLWGSKWENALPFTFRALTPSFYDMLYIFNGIKLAK